MSYFTTPKKLSWAISITLLVITLVLDIFLFQFLQGNTIVQILISILILLPLFYFSISISLEKFIYSKIKIIYKTIHDFKRGKGEKIGIDFTKNDFLENVNKDVEEWAVKKSAEIEHLEEMAVYRREFMGNVFHELKTPIFNIQGYIHTLLDGGIDDKKINIEYLERSVKSIDRMILLIHDLEKISSLESGKLEIKQEIFSLIELTKEVVEFLEFKLQKGGIKISIQGENQVLVKADKEKIREVLINLIDNAIKYIGNNANPCIKITFFDMDENILCEVTDNGIGIPQSDLPRVFERFYRADKARTRDLGGTGLGLAIVKHIIEAHQQTIHIRSKIEVGTTLAFTLKKAK